MAAVALALVFFVGVVGTVATCFRIWRISVVMRSGLNFTSPRWFYAVPDLILFSQIEVNLATMCVNAPAVAALWNTLRAGKETTTPTPVSGPTGCELERLGGRDLDRNRSKQVDHEAQSLSQERLCPVPMVHLSSEISMGHTGRQVESSLVIPMRPPPDRLGGGRWASGQP